MRKWINYFVEHAIPGGNDIYPQNPRGLEWLLSFVMLLTGVVALFFGHEGMVIPTYLSVICGIGGVVRIGALVVNGYWKRSPVLRLAGSILGGFVWSTFALIAMHGTDASSMAGIIYPLFVWAELYSCSRSARDMIVADAEFHGEYRDESASST